MKLAILLAFALATLLVQASWFGSDPPEYTKWDSTQLQKWLKNHDIKVPKSYSQDQLQELVKENWHSSRSWTQDQYNRAQKSFENIKDSTFDAWDESRLREWLLEQGIVAPSGPREQLVLLAKQRYKGYKEAASSFTNTASSAVSDTSKSAQYYVTMATDEVGRRLEDAKDYIYSSWDESQLRSWLVSQGAIKSDEQKSRDEMLKLMREYYAAAADPVWSAWSDSYMREWLLGHGLIKSDYEKNRDALNREMKKYYYDVSDKVYNTWSDSDLKQWLVDHRIIKSDAQLQREKMVKLVSDNYSSASDTFWSAWSESDMRSWLTSHGYLKSDAQARYDELVKLMNEKYSDYTSRTFPFLTWPDARLRAYLRGKGISEGDMPTSRSELLHEVRIRYVQTTNSAQALLNKIRDTVNSGVEAVEEKIGRVLELLSGSVDNVKHDAEDKASKEWEEKKEKVDEARKKTEL